jgi:hypothetical protein
MATERKTADAIERLNALIDGELPPAEHAALADRIAAERDLAHAHATLARLKACIVEKVESTPPVEFVLPKPKRPILSVLGMAAAAAIAVFAILIGFREPEHEQTLNAEIAPIVTLAALPAQPFIPDLTNAGLKLVGGEVERSGQTAVLVAAYRGPRGCRLELRVWPAATRVSPTIGTSRRTWMAGDLVYELVAFGMPAGRFAAVAAAAEAATRSGRMPKEADTRLREARLAALPCVG